MQLLNRIPQLASLQISWLLLYFCAVPRMNHLLRTLPPRLVEQLAIEHNNRIWETFCKIFTIPDADAFDANLNRVPYTCCRRQAKLPMRYGGLGLRDSLRVSPAAYWASWGDSLPILMHRFHGGYKLNYLDKYLIFGRVFPTCWLIFPVCWIVCPIFLYPPIFVYSHIFVRIPHICIPPIFV